MVTDEDPIRKEYPDNVWVSELPGFNEVNINAYRSFEIAGGHLMRAIAVYLDLPENYFEKKYTMETVSCVPFTIRRLAVIRNQHYGPNNMKTLI